jgi:hypothetical protein
VTRGNEKAGGTVRFVSEVCRIDNKTLYGGAALIVVGTLFDAAISLGQAIVGPRPRLVLAATEAWGLR